MIIKRFIFVFGFFSLLPLLFFPAAVFAAVTVTPATGGVALSADDVGGSYTALTGPVVSEGATGDVGTGTIILNVPSGFIFDIGGTTPTVLVTRTAGSGSDTRNINDLASGSTIAVTRTTTQLTITITASTSNSVRNSLTWQNVRVRPSNGTPLASGNIVKTGTSSIAGVTDSVTNFGTLTEVPGAKNKLSFTVQPSTSATTNTDFTIKPTIVMQDQFGNTVTTDSGSTVARTAVLSTQSCGGTAGSGTLSSTPANGAAVSSGVMAYTAMQYSAGESIKLCASSAGVTSALSNAVTVNKITTATTLGTSASSQVYGTSVTFTATVTPASDGPASGTVTFKDGAVTIGTGTLNGANPGVATYATSTLSVSGSPHSITAEYNGDSAFFGSTSGAVSQTMTAKTLTVTGITANNKIYDGNTTATLNTAGATLVGVVSGDNVTLNTALATGTFDTASAGLGKTVTVSGLSLSGTDALNYALIQPTTVANITNPLPTTTSISPSSKNIGDTSFSMIINGTNFINGSVVNFNGSPRTTAYSSSTQLTATILTSDMSVATSSALITVTNPAPGGGVSNAQIFSVVTIATQFVILPPSSGTVDAPVVVTVQAQKSGGEIDTAYQNDVTLNTAGSATGGGLVNIVNGVGTLSLSDTVAETVQLSLVDSQGTGLAVTSVQNLVFAPGALKQFTLNNPGNMNARTRLGYVLTRKDQYNNSVLTGTTTAYLYTSSTGTGATNKFYDDSVAGNIITSIPFANGFSSANFWYYDETPGTFTITASDNATSPDGAAGIADATRLVTVIPVAVKFVISSAATTTVDTPITVTVQAQKPDNSVDTGYNGGVTVVTSGSATGGGLVTLTNGIGTKAIADTVPETVHLSLSDTQTTGLNVSSFADVVWNAGVTTQLSLNHPPALSVGNRAAYTVTRKDQYGNTTTSATTTVYFYSSSSGANKKFYNAATAGSVITSLVIPPGQSSGQFWYYDELSGSWSITASDNPVAPDGAAGISDAVDALSAVPGAVSQFTLNNPGNMTAGTRLGYIVTRKDSFGNLVTAGATSAYLYSTAGVPGVNRAFYPVASGGSAVASVTINNGSSNVPFWYYENTPGSYVVTASDNPVAPDGVTGIVDGTANVTVVALPIVATRFVILDPPSATVDAPVTVTIQAQNDAGSLDTSATSSVTLLTSLSATGGGLVTLTNGVGTIQISDHAAETVALTLADTQGTGLNVSSVKNIVFAAGATTQFFIDNPGDMAAGTRLGLTVTRKDQYGNPVTSGIGGVYLYSSSAGASKKFYDASSGGSVITFASIQSGQSSAPFWYYDELSGTTTVTVSDNATAPDGAVGITDTQRTFTVAPAAIAKFAINHPGNMTAGTRLGYTLTRKDRFDNLVTSGIVSAYLYSSSAATSTKFYDAAAGGFSTVLAVFPDGNSIARFWYYDETPGTFAVTASDGTPAPNGVTGILDAADSVTVIAVPIVATRFIIQPMNNSTVGIPVTATIRAEDNSGNVDTANNAKVTLNVSGSGSGGGLVTLANGIGTVSVNDAVPETITLSLSDTQNTGLNASSTRTVTFSAGVPSPASIGGGGSGEVAVYSTPAVAKFHFSGKAFPAANLHIVAIGGAGTVQKQTVSVSPDGIFSFSPGGIPENTRSYGVFATDKNNRSTQVKIFDANLADAKLLLDVNNILLSPTLGLVRGSVTKGDTLGISGSATPLYSVEIEVDKQPVTIMVKADGAGTYKAIISTASLDYGSHTVRTRQISPSGVKSEFSPQAVFSVVNIFTPNMDFNRDSAVNVKDWSIFVSRWSSANQKMRAEADLNGNGKTDVQDLSIFVRTLKPR